ncbi:MAG: family 20 glycosylhydrolase [Cytophagaceae bacterium]|nr:family 20 glycosylhydrolase [Cytophagaceae bacterium]
MKKIFFLFLISLSSFAQNTYNIIPKPQKLEVAKGQFKITNTTPIIVPAGDTEVRKIAEQLSTKIKVVWGYENQITETLKPNGLRFINNAAFAEEAYELKVSPQNIEITASNPKGHFYGYQTLLQLLPIEIFGSSRISKTILAASACTVTDEPRFPYRGIMLDVSRHFFPADFIKKLIDNLAVNKINTLHWHLTDDQGWRIEIKKYPKLTEVGSIRKESMVGHYREQKFDGKPYGGFYTQDQIKDIVAYAKSKYVTVIPEIEMPGHAMGALTAYPELGCTGGPYEVRTLWGVEDKVYCPSEKTFSFLEDVLTEVMDLFPSKYIHIGGDECPKDSWKASAFCQDLMKKEGLKDEHELQSYFIRRIDKFVTSKGRRIIGWDEILEGGLSPNATVMSWRGIEGGIEAAKQMHDVIMTPTSYMYLDYYQGNPAKEPLAIGGFLNLEKTYSFEPQVAELNPEQAKYILGVQGNLWTEYVKTPQHAEYMLFPRALAIAEIGWSDKTKNFINFSSRLDTHLKRLELMAVNYSKSANNVSFSTELNTQKRTVVKLSTAHPSGQIRYTLDGSSPIATSLLYNPSTKIKILGDHTLAAAVFDAGGKNKW